MSLANTKATATFTVGDVPIRGDLVLAPLAGFSDQPFRSICRTMGSAMSYTELLPVQGYLEAELNVLHSLRFTPAERPIVFQVVGHDPRRILKACLRLQELGPDIIDVNLGCPAKRVTGQGNGAALLRSPAKLAEIFGTLSARLSVPVTGKMRLGWDEESINHLEVARILQDNGACLIAVHGRTRSQDYRTPADWDAIAEVKRAVDIPVLANGDVSSPDDVDRIKSHTGCDGVMIGRAAIGNPWIFQGRPWQEVSAQERLEMIARHLDLVIPFYGERKGILLFRKHLVKYVRGLPGATRTRALLMSCVTRAQVLECLNRCLFLHPAQNML